MTTTAQKPKSEKARLSAEERRESIIHAAIPVFAKKGFAAATTRDLASAAGISEALLYRHFPSKESLHEHIQEQICNSESSIHDYIRALEPGTESLVKIIYLVFKIIFELKTDHPLGRSIHRLMIQSLLEDGEFTRSFNEPRFKQMVPHIEASASAAREAGEMVDMPMTDSERLWFPHHLSVGLRLASLPENQVFDYDTQPPQRKLNAVWFSLRGMGLTDEAIKRYFKPDILGPEIDDVLVRAGMYPPLQTKP